MSIFNILKIKSQKSCLGVDLGSSSIKIVELCQDLKGIELRTYGLAKFKMDDIKKDPVAQQEKFAAVLAKLCVDSKIITRNAIASLPPFFVFSSITSLPEMSKEDMESAVQWEAKKVIPLPIEQIELKWRIINIKNNEQKSKQKSGEQENNKKKENKKVQVLLTGAAKKLIQRYIYVFRRAGLNLCSLETESFALSRSLSNENDKSVVMIVDIGALNTNIAIIKLGIPFLNKSIDIGSITISKIIANSLNISIERAEQFQYDIGVNLGRERNNISIPKIVEDALSSIINEIKYSFNLYEEYKGSILEPDDKIEKVILCGGGATIPNLSEYLSELLNIKVYIRDPWTKLQYPNELKMILQEIGPNFAVAIGLAMRHFV
ncbi:type IV pilus assembly protein PilM [Patescibacteria group bacterium]